MSAEDPGCQHSAGVLKDGKLSEPAYNKIIQDIKDAGQLGFGAVSMFPCTTGAGLPASIGIVPQDLEDKEKYPDFHKNVMGMFEKVALALDLKGNFSLPFPLWDPFAIALKLELDPPSFQIPDLPTLTPPDLLLSLNLKFPKELPDITALLSIPEFPKLNIPSLDLSINSIEFPTFLDFNLWPLKLPDLVLGLAVPPDLNLILDLIKIPPSPCPIIETVVKAQLFGPTNEGDLTKIIAIQELATFTGQCASVTVAAMLVGDGGESGVTGNLGTQYGWREATPSDKKNQDAFKRNDLIIAYKAIFDKEPTQKEAQFIQVIGKMENAYGTAWWGKSKKAKIPPDAKTSNNWGNIHGQGSAGSFQWIDFDANDKPYTVSFAKYASSIDGAYRLIQELFKRRPYIHDAILNGTTLEDPIFKMSSKFTLSNAAPAGALTYYVADPKKYFNSALISIKTVMKNLDEGTEYADVPGGKLPDSVIEGAGNPQHENDTT